LWFSEIIPRLLEKRDLNAAEMRAVMLGFMLGKCGEVETAALLIALRMKGETAAEIAAAAEVLREHMVRLETGRDDVLDTCGTGGDELGTFNISTATAFIAAGAGVPVVKHGNRAVSSRSGSADVLAALGVEVQENIGWAERCLNCAGLAFCFAPHFHPALRHVAAVRRRLQVRTLLNCLGPLANPAGAAFQLLGVGRVELLDPMAEALARLGTRHAFLVCGLDGLDEVTLAAPTLVREVHNGRITDHQWTAADFGLAPCQLADLKASGPEPSAALIRAILAGEDGPPMRIVLANAAAALLAAERVTSLGEGAALAREVLRSGRAKAVLEQLQRCSRPPAGLP
jgi:anthranilate phosphoribosyltransferase